MVGDEAPEVGHTMAFLQFAADMPESHLRIRSERIGEPRLAGFDEAFDDLAPVTGLKWVIIGASQRSLDDRQRIVDFVFVDLGQGNVIIQVRGLWVDFGHRVREGNERGPVHRVDAILREHLEVVAWIVELGEAIGEILPIIAGAEHLQISQKKVAVFRKIVERFAHLGQGFVVATQSSVCEREFMAHFRVIAEQPTVALQSSRAFAESPRRL